MCGLSKSMGLSWYTSKSRRRTTGRNLYINNNLQSGTFKRTHEGDHHVTEEELTLLIRDSSDNADLRIDRRTDKIVMRNPGTLRISPERIYNGDYTQARNSTIQKMLRMVGFGDNIGSRFRKILNAWKVLGFVTPDILEEDEVNEVWLTLPLYESNQINAGVNCNDSVNEGVNEGANCNDSVNEGEPSEIKTTQCQKEIINLIKKSPTITAKQMSETLSVNISTIERNIATLKSKGLLKRKGSDKNGEWILQL